MRLLLSFLLVTSCTTSSITTQNVYDNKVASHYAGCMEGFMEIYKLGMYQRPPRYGTDKTAYKRAFKDIQAACMYRNMLYKFSLENGEL